MHNLQEHDFQSQWVNLRPFNEESGIQVRSRIQRRGQLWGMTQEFIGQEILWPTQPGSISRRDELWKSTCSECFIAVGEKAYIECNFSPDGGWNAYLFDDYRQGMRAAPVELLSLKVEDRRLFSEFKIDLEILESAISMTAVVAHKESPSRNSYWAISHRGDKPDFHLGLSRTSLSKLIEL